MLMLLWSSLMRWAVLSTASAGHPTTCVMSESLYSLAREGVSEGSCGFSAVRGLDDTMLLREEAAVVTGVAAADTWLEFWWPSVSLCVGVGGPRSCGEAL